MDIRKKFGDKVKFLRKEKNLSQEELAHNSTIDRTYISDIEKGECIVSIMINLKLEKSTYTEINNFFTINIITLC
jgi:transcriptional regulator with XRE-family HTH domain